MRAFASLPLNLETTVVKNKLVQKAHLPLKAQQYQRLQGLGKQENKFDYMSIKKESKGHVHAHVTRVYARIGFFSHLFSLREGVSENERKLY